MDVRRFGLAVVALLAAVLGTIAWATAPETPAYYVVRHFDTPAGERDPDLTDAGKARAAKLAGWFKGRKLAAIYVSDFKRTRQTIAPLVAERGMIEVAVYDPANTPALVARIKAAAGAVLVVGHSNTVPDIVEQLGGERPGPLVHEDFGDVWTIASGKTVRERLTLP
jgi:broad specificity phosphatase PhoE